MPVSTSQDVPPEIRLCHLKIWHDFDGYGFNLRCITPNKVGQSTVGDIKENSPAHLGGLKEHDRLVEVNSVNISKCNHAEVVKRIKAVPNETVLLVVDPESSKYYKSKNITISSTMRNVVKLYAPEKNPNSVDSTVIDMPSSPVNGASSNRKLCVLTIKPNFQGYGFNLHANKSDPGQFIGEVDHGSPAEDAGLVLGDKVVSVNNIYTVNKSHTDVVKIIKTDPNSVSITVVDKNLPYPGPPSEDSSIHINGHSDMSNGSIAKDDSIIIHADPAQYKAKLCTLKIWDGFDGYGFVLHVEKSSVGHFVGDVEDGSPAQAAGLEKKDNLVEVNGLKTVGLSHDDVVHMIKHDPKRVTLLVADVSAYLYFKENDIVVHGGMDNIVKMECPDSAIFNASTLPLPDTIPPPIIDEIHTEAETELELPPPPFESETICPPPPESELNIEIAAEPVIELIAEPVVEASAEILVESELIVETPVETVVATTVESEVEVTVESEVVAAVAVEALAEPVVETLPEPIVDAVVETVVESPTVEPTVESNVEASVELSPEPILEAEAALESAAIAADIVAAIPAEETLEPPRLCTVRKWYDYQGYGFNLHAEKGKSGHFIGNIDDGSPASASGLKTKDVMIEVNGSNVEDYSHLQLVTAIKEKTSEVSILVITRTAYEEYGNKDIKISGDMANIEVISCPVHVPPTEDVKIDTAIESEAIELPPLPTEPVPPPPEPVPEVSAEVTPEVVPETPAISIPAEVVPDKTPEPAKEETPAPNIESQSPPAKVEPFALSVAEMRAQLNSKSRKQAIRSQNQALSVKDKHALFQSM